MNIIAKTELNKKTCYYGKSLVNHKILEKLSVVAEPDVAKNYTNLMRLLQSQEVTTFMFSPTDILAITSTEQLMLLWDNTSKEEKTDIWLIDDNGTSRLFEDVLLEFGTNGSNFFVDVEADTDELFNHIKQFNESIKNQFSKIEPNENIDEL